MATANASALPDCLSLQRRACVAILLVTVAGCGKHAPSGQTVATVNGQNITQSELNVDLAAAGVTPANKARAQGQVLQSMIDRTLIDQQAKKDGIDKSPEFILIEQRAHDILLAQRALQTATATGQTPPTETEINDYLDKHPALGSARATLVIDQIKFPSPRTAVEAKTLEGIKTVDQLVAQLQLRGAPFERGQVTIDSAQVPDAIITKLRKMSAGEPLVIVQGAGAVANVLVSEKPSTADSSDAANIAKQRLISERTQAALRQHQDSLRRNAQIQYAPGFAPKSPVLGATPKSS